MTQDYYKTLNVDRKATPEEIKKQFRKLARKYHPDVSKEKDAEEKFKQVKEAYDVLKDAEKRKAYDQFGNQWQHAQGFQPPPGWQAHTSGGQTINPEDFGDIFESVFGGFQSQRPRGSRRSGGAFFQKGSDQHSKITITLEEAYKGSQRALNLTEHRPNPKTGQMEVQNRQVNVKIPAGVHQGQQIRLNGLGGVGSGGAPNGDLYLEIELAPHRLFTIEGKDIYLKLPITPWEAALGATIEVPTLAGTVKLKIPSGSQTGNKLRLKGRGLPGKISGDEFVLLNIYIPEPKTDEEKNLYQLMKEKMDFNPRKHLMEQG